MSTQERARDKTLQDSFPASDPPANSGVAGGEWPDKRSDQRDAGEVPTGMPTGMPTSDRDAIERAHHWEDEAKPKG